MKNALFFALLIMSSQVFAKNKVQVLLEEKSSSPYEVLMKFHESDDGVSVSPEDLNGFDLDLRVPTIKFQQCRLASTSGDLRSIDFVAFNRTKIIPATPPQGPLFPGTPEQRISRFSLGLSYESLISNPSNGYEDILDTSTWERTPQMTTITVSEDGHDLFYAEVKIHGDLLSFLIRSAYPSYNTKYGYCWNE